MNDVESGFGPSDTKRWVFRIEGMDCAEEIGVLKRALGALVDPERQLAFDLLQGRLIVSPGDRSVNPQAIIDAVGRTGMRAEVWEAGAVPVEGGLWQRHGRNVLTGISGLMLAGGLVLHAAFGGGFWAALTGHTAEGAAAGPTPWIAIGAYLVSILTGMGPVFPKAIRAALGLRPDMNLLMSVAVVGAAAIDEWFEASAVAFLFSVSLVLESWSVGRARRAIAALLDLAPPTARVRQEDGAFAEMPSADVPVGAIFLVRPGEKIPLDGTVVTGRSHVDQSPITGESVPVEKESGGEVYAGTINGEGILEVECTRPLEQTTLAGIIRMVGQAQSRRAPSERWVERFARVYTPIVMIGAIAVMIIPPLLLDGEWGAWFYRALVLLVIACPCALVISTPVSIVASLASAARHGVLIKGGLYVEAPARLKAIAMDKTGTLTEGRPRVVEMVPLAEHDVDDLLARAAALEAHSNHPLARAIMDQAEQRGVSPAAAETFTIIPGKGAVGTIDGRAFWLGSHRLLEERGQETSEIRARLESMQQAGQTVVVVGNDRHVCGFIALADTVRETSRQAIRQMRQEGVEKLVMLTGDNRGTAEAIAAEVGMDEVQAELLPEDKVHAVAALVERYGQVAMIGDGVNDAPALARASLGIAMGAVGSDAAIETADIALMSDDLTHVPWLIRHSRRTLAIIHQNIVFAVTVKVLVMLLTFVGFASLWAAIAADMGASLLVIFNGLRLLRSSVEPASRPT